MEKNQYSGLPDFANQEPATPPFVEGEIFSRRQEALEEIDFEENPHLREFIEDLIKRDKHHSPLSMDGMISSYCADETSQQSAKRVISLHYIRKARLLLNRQYSPLEIMECQSKGERYYYARLEEERSVNTSVTLTAGEEMQLSPTFENHDDLVEALLSMPPGAKRVDDVPDDKELKALLYETLPLTRDKREWVEKKFGLEVVRQVTHRLLQPEFEQDGAKKKRNPINEFKDFTGSCIDLMRNSGIGFGYFAQYFNTPQSGVENGLKDSAQVEKFFMETAERAFQAYWQEAPTNEDGPEEIGARRCLQYLKKEGWSRSEVISVIRNHFDISQNEEDTASSPL